METRRPVVGIDLDNVLSRSDEVIRGLLRSEFGLALEQKHVVEFDYWRCGATREQSDRVLTLFHESHCATVEVVDGAPQAVGRLAVDFRIEIVTSRPLNTRQMTLDWLADRGIRYDDVLFASDKVGVARQCRAFVEDNAETALAIADEGVPVMLFSYPWNAHATHSNLHRVSSWVDAARTLTELVRPSMGDG